MTNEFAATVDAIKELMKRGEAIFFLEIRRAGDKDLAVMKVRGALRLTGDEVQKRLDQIPRERTVVLYSTAPDDDPAILAARLLKEHGFPNLQVLGGGFKSWLLAGLPVEDVGAGKNMTRTRGM